MNHLSKPLSSHQVTRAKPGTTFSQTAVLDLTSPDNACVRIFNCGPTGTYTVSNVCILHMGSNYL